MRSCSDTGVDPPQFNLVPRAFSLRRRWGGEKAVGTSLTSVSRGGFRKFGQRDGCSSFVSEKKSMPELKKAAKYSVFQST